MISLRRLFAHLLFFMAFDFEMAAAQSLGAREASLLASHWDRKVVSKEDRIRAIDKIANLRGSQLTDDILEGEYLTGLTPFDTTLKYLQNNLGTMSEMEQFWIARNLLGKLLVIDTSSTQLHEIVVQLLGSSSYGVHFQTVHTLLDAPIGSGDDLELCRRTRDAISSSLDIEGEGALCRRLLYRMQRALGPNHLIEGDVHSCLQYLTQDAKFDPEIMAEALVSAATLHEFPLSETELVRFAATLDVRSEASAIVELVRYLFFGRPEDATSLVKIARKAQHHNLFFELLEKGQFPLSADQSAVSKMVALAAVSNEVAPPNVQLWKLAKEPFQMIIKGKSQPEWLSAARRGQISALHVTEAGIANEDPIILLGAIDGQSLERTVAMILESDKMWYRLYQLENLFLIQHDLGKEIGAVLKDGKHAWYVKYLIVRELSSPTRVDEVIEPELLVSLIADDKSPYFVVTRSVLSLAKVRNIHLEGTTEDTVLGEHVCPDIRRAFRSLAP